MSHVNLSSYLSGDLGNVPQSMSDGAFGLVARAERGTCSASARLAASACLIQKRGIPG